MGRLKRRSSLIAKTSSGQRFSSTPVRTSRSNDPRQRHLKPHRARRHDPQLSPLSESEGYKKDLKPHGKRGGHLLIGGSRKGQNKLDAAVTPSVSRDPSQDSTSMTLPSGVSSFLLDCMDSDTPASSSADSPLSSPEVFREADVYEEGTALLSEDDMLDFHVKNSTLLNLSHAQDISMQQLPNLSSILAVSPVAENRVVEKRHSRGNLTPEGLWMTRASGCSPKTVRSDERTPQTSSAVVSLSVGEKKVPPGRIKAIRCRKKVTFSDAVCMRDITVEEPGEGGLHGQAADELRREVETQSRDLLNTQQQMQTTPEDLSPEPAKFFDFADVSERHAFFQKVRWTYSFQFPSKLMETSLEDERVHSPHSHDMLVIDE